MPEKELSEKSYEVPLQMIEDLKKDDSLRQVLESQSGSWENYTVGQHTLMVMNQYEKYFSGKPLPLDLDENSFLRILLVHDLGKAKAVAEGDKDKQHEYNVDLGIKILKELGSSEKEINIAKALLCGDTFGKYVGSRNYEIEKTVSEIKEISETAGIGIEDLLNLLMVYYQCDAGAYTEDATIEGIVVGKKSIDRYFVFSPEKREMKFSADSQRKIDLLKKELGI